MSEPSRFLSVSPIGDTDPLALPIADADRAVTFYTTALGFTLTNTQNGPPRLALLSRDDVTLGVAENGGDPEQASCYLAVTDVPGLQAEYRARGADVSEVGEMKHDAGTIRSFGPKTRTASATAWADRSMKSEQLWSSTPIGSLGTINTDEPQASQKTSGAASTRDADSDAERAGG